MKFFKYLFFIFLTPNLFAQLQNNNWVFGYGGSVNFSGPNPVSSLVSISSNEQTASVSDPVTGQLLFYTDSRNVWNANNQVMPNGASLLGGFFTSSTQGALIVPFPDNSQKYYIFTLDEIEIQPGNPVTDDGLRYSVVDMSLDGGLGDVEVVGMNTLLATDLTEKLIVIRSPQIQGFWVIAHKRTVNEFLAWRVDACGVSSQPVVSTVGSLFSPVPIGANEGWAGAMDASPNGDRIGMPVDWSDRIEFFDFDKTTGIVSNPLTVNVTDDATPPFLRKYGACFSPDGSKFYYTNTNSIYQLDLTNYNVPAITTSFTLIASTMSAPVPYPCFQIEQAPNNKLYVAIGNAPRLDEIANPNAQGLACGYIANAVNLAPGVCQLGLPAQVPLGGFAACNANPCPFNLNLTVVQPSCGNDDGCISFNPSPADTYFYLWPFPTNFLVDSVCGLAPGSYQIRITNSSGCSIDTTIVLTNIPGPAIPTVTTTPATCLSAGTATISNYNGTQTYVFNPAGPTVGTGGIISGLIAGTFYTVSATSGSCTSAASNSFSITQQQNTLSATTNSTATTCGNNNGTATVVINGGTAPFNISWNTTPVQTNLTATNLPSGTYSCTVTDQNGCSVTSTVQVNGSNPPNVSASSNGSYCSGGTVILSALGGVNYVWSGPNGFSSNVQQPQISPANVNQSGTYTVTISDANGCDSVVSINLTIGGAIQTPVQNVSACNSYTAPWGTNYTQSGIYSDTIFSAGCDSLFIINLEILQIPTVEIRWDSILCSGETLTLNAFGTNIQSYLWSDGSSAQQLIVSSAGTYSVTAENSCGEVSSSINVVETDCDSTSCEFLIPNAFTPNGDGVNDNWYVQCIELYPDNEVEIYNRWGQQVYAIKNYSGNWDGTFNGTILPDAAYYYILKIKFPLPTGERIFTGTVSIIR